MSTTDYWKPFKVTATGWTTTDKEDIRKKVFRFLASLSEVPEVVVMVEE